MALKLLAVLIVLAVMSAAPHYARYRRWHWYESWLAQLHGSAGLSWLLLAVAAPVAILALIDMLLDRLVLGDLLGFLLALGVLALCLDELEPDIDAVLEADDATARARAVARLDADAANPTQAMPQNAADVAASVVLAALRRRFGVIFWFFVLGPAGALLFRLGQRAERATAAGEDHDAARLARMLANALDWLPAHLMVFAMALAADFDAVIGAWRAWHAAAPGRRFDSGFLPAVARAGIDDDDDLEQIARASEANAPLAALRRLLLRVLVIWLALAALVVVAGAIG